MSSTVAEDYFPAYQRLREQAQRLVGRPDVFVMEARTAQGGPPLLQPNRVFVYADDGRTVRGLGTPLMMAAHCPDPAAWPTVDAAFERLGFERFGPMSEGGDQSYVSKHRAVIVVPEHPGATRAVEMTGKPVLGWIVEP